jgi:hypothetical protein
LSIAALVYVKMSLTAVILNGGRAVGHNFEMGLPKDYPSQIWFNLVQWFQRKRLILTAATLQ